MNKEKTCKHTIEVVVRVDIECRPEALDTVIQWVVRDLAQHSVECTGSHITHGGYYYGGTGAYLKTP